MTGWASGAPAWSRLKTVTADQARGWLPWSAVAASCGTLAVIGTTRFTTEPAGYSYRVTRP